MATARTAADTEVVAASRVLVTGASGSGTSTLGRSVATALGYDALDGDDFYWLPTTPPYREKRAPDERLATLCAALTPQCVVSGSVVNWGDGIENAFDLIVYLWVPPDERVDRLRRRELAELGFVDEEFLAWAAQYDEGQLSGRSRKIHERWLAARSCPVLRIEGAVEVVDAVALVCQAIASGRSAGDTTCSPP